MKSLEEIVRDNEATTWRAESRAIGTLYVPMVDGSEAVLDRIRTSAIRLFGGCTETQADGVYAMQDGSIAYDKITVLTVIGFRTVVSAYLARYAAIVKYDLRQESVLYTVQPIEVVFA